MRSIIVAFLFCLTSTIANAQAFSLNQSVICDESKKIIDALTEKWGEKLVWVASDAVGASKFGLFVNQKTNTWTILQFTPDIACVIGLGEKSQLILGTSI